MQPWKGLGSSQLTACGLVTFMILIDADKVGKGIVVSKEKLFLFEPVEIPVVFLMWFLVI